VTTIYRNLEAKDDMIHGNAIVEVAMLIEVDNFVRCKWRIFLPNVRKSTAVTHDF